MLSKCLLTMLILSKRRPAPEDADVTLRLHETLVPKLEAEAALNEVYQRLELPLVPVLSKIERNGAFVQH